jgi:hypothetical protein
LAGGRGNSFLRAVANVWPHAERTPRHCRALLILAATLAVHLVIALALKPGRNLPHTRTADPGQAALVAVTLHVSPPAAGRVPEPQALTSDLAEATKGAFAGGAVQARATGGHVTDDAAAALNVMRDRARQKNPQIEKNGSTESIPDDKSSILQSAGSDALYLQPRDVTERPQLLQDIVPRIRLNGLDVPTQTVVLRLLISEFGYIDRVDIDKSQLPAPAQKSVTDVFSTLKFSPAKRNGTPVKSQIRIEVALDSVVPVSVISNKQFCDDMAPSNCQY